MVWPTYYDDDTVMIKVMTTEEIDVMTDTMQNTESTHILIQMCP